ncbi:MAG: FKBP-type peptidyl-prolyl cis-trans isomerase [Myxococcota bacterium]
MSTRAPDAPIAAVALRVVAFVASASVVCTACHEPPHADEPHRSEERAVPEEGLAPVPPALRVAGLVRAPGDAVRTSSGVRWILLEEGAGRVHPGPRDAVEVEFVAWTDDGRLLDSTADAAVPTAFPLNAVAPGLAEVLEDMVVGERRRIWLPAELAQGDCPRRSPPPGRRVMMDLELVAVERSQGIPAPEDVEGPPPGVPRDRDGLAWYTLEAGAQGTRPSGDDAAIVHYTGWTPDGETFDSSLLRGEPAIFVLERLIPGLRRPLLDMEVGERRRVWVPAELAWGAHPTEPGVPAGDVVFDLELIGVR